MSDVPVFMLLPRSFLTTLLAAPLVVLTRLRGGEVVLSDPVPARPDLPLTPDDEPELLARWRRALRTPILVSDDPTAARLLAAIRADERVEIDYAGDATPLTRRAITPGQLYAVEGFSGIYVSGYCHLRAAERTFLLDRMRLTAPAGDQAA